jgi:maltoporin
MKWRLVFTSTLLMSSSLGFAQSQYDLDYNFYFRTGLSYSRSNVDGVCYSSPGWPDIHPRFGNECGNYAEIMLRKNYRPTEGNANAPWFRGQVTFSVTSDGNQTDEQVKPENRPNNAGPSGTYDFGWGHRELFVEGINLVGQDSKLWVGKRFYQRLHIPMWDFFMMADNGNGFGAYDIPMGTGKFALAWMRHVSGADDSQPFHNNIDVRYSLPMGESVLHTIVIAGEQGPLDARSGEEKWEKVTGQSLTLFLENNERPYQYKIVGQYGRGLYGARPDHYQGGWSSGSMISRFEDMAFSSLDPAEQERAEAWQDSYSWRVLGNLLWAPDAPYWVETAAFYGSSDFGGRKDAAGEELDARDTLALGVKPVYAFTQNHSAEVDLYWSLIKNGMPYQDSQFQTKYDGKPIDRELSKATLAYVLRPLAFDWARPVFRFYGTYAKWNDKIKGDNYVTSYLRPLYKDKTSGYTLGVMADVWL